MKTKFKDFVNENVMYPKDYFMNNIPKHIEHADLWVKAAEIATDNIKKESSFGTVTAIYNNLNKKQIENRADWKVLENPTAFRKYWRNVLNLSNRLSQKDRDFYNRIIDFAERAGKISPKQYAELKRLERGDFKRYSK